MPCATEYSASSTGYDSLRLDSFSQDVELLHHLTQISQPLVVFLWCHLPLIMTCICKSFDRIPSTTPGAEPPRDARDSGSAKSHSMHLETSSSDRP